MLELITAFTDPRNEELEILLSLLESELAWRGTSTENPALIETCAWRAFFTSISFFQLADANGYIERWLNSGEDGIESCIVSYLRFHIKYYGDRVAELLEPFAGIDEKWNDRLRFVMQNCDLSVSRRFFNLFLKLLENGILDNLRCPFATNSTFWNIHRNLSKQEPGWCAELAARWLNRKTEIAIASGDIQCRPDLQDQFGIEEVLHSARAAPKEFLVHVLPAILSSGKLFVYDIKANFQCDAVWSIRVGGEYIDMPRSFVRGCELAFESLGRSGPDDILLFVETLRGSRLSIAHYLLQSAYIAAPEFFADEAIALLANEPSRLCCLDSGRSSARLVIQKCSAHCSCEVFLKLEKMLFDYNSEYESTPEGFRAHGYSAYILMSALDQSRCQESTKRRIGEWLRKFGSIDEAAHEPEGFDLIQTPIAPPKIQHMTDEQWLRAILKYDSEFSPCNLNGYRGGAHELATELREQVKKDPDRFARLSLQFPKEVNTIYPAYVQYGLRESTVDSSLKIAVAKYSFGIDDKTCIKATLGLLSSIKDMMLPDDTLEFIRRMATTHPDHEASSDISGDTLYQGVYTVRDHGVVAIRDLIIANYVYLDVFREAIMQIMTDSSLAVRSLTASLLLAASRFEQPWAIDQFKRLLGTDYLLLSSHYVQSFIASNLQQEAEDLLPAIEMMLSSEKEAVRQSGARLACLAHLYHPNLESISNAAIHGDTACRLGAAQVASHNLTNPDCRTWCEETLILFFNDQDADIRRQAAQCFSLLWHNSELPIIDYENLICSFLESSAFVDEPTLLLHALESTRHQIPNSILDVCSIFISRCSQGARDIRTSYAGDGLIVGRLVFTVYAQLNDSVLRDKSLRLIDQMCAEGLHGVTSHLIEYER